MLKISNMCIIAVLFVMLLPLFAPGTTKDEEELYNKTTWRLYVDLKMPGLKPEVFQWALFDEDPAIGYKSNIARMRSIIEKKAAETTDEKTKNKAINSWMRVAWGMGFKDVTGDKVYLWSKIYQKEPCIRSNEPDAKKWLVTKIVSVKDEPVCWAIPIDTKIGQEIRLTLNKDNAFDLRQAFDEAMSDSFAGVSKEPSESNNYPRDTTFKDDPDAHALYDKMVNTIQKHSTLYYEIDQKFGREGEEPMKSNCKIWLKKPDFARIEAYRNQKLIGTLVGDGDYFWIFWPRRRPQFGNEDITEYVKTCSTSYMKVLSPPKRHSLWHQFSYLGACIPAFQPSLFHGCIDAMAEYLDGVRNIGTEKVGGEDCSIVEVSYMDNQRSKYYWIAPKDFLPRQVKEVVRVSYNLISTESWTNIKINQEIADDKFKWQPPDNWSEWFLPDDSKSILEVGTMAPDFEFTGTGGEKIKLSDYKGKVVLLNFWRVGCPPCREEIPHLAQLYNKFKDAGLVVIGFNSSDDQQTVLDLLGQYGTNYPNIINTTPAAQNIQFYEYQKLTGYSAVPLNYIIDRDGKIADAWYGFDADEADFLEKKLEPLGFK